MKLSRLWVFLAIGLPVLGALLAGMATVDLTYHLRAGAEILAGQGIPDADTWTFTATGQPWVDQQWGAQVILAVVYQVGSWTGLVLLRAALTGFIFGCLYLISRRRGLIPRDAAVLTLIAFGLTAIALALRPQLIGMAFFAAVLVLVTDRRAHPGRLWLIPILVIPWANIHGTFFLAPAVLGLAWLEDLHDRVARPHRALLVALVCLPAACLTPFGPAVWVYALGLSTNDFVQDRITEWQPTSLRSVPGALFFISALAVVVLIARRGARTSWPLLAWLGFFFAVGIYAVRGIAWWPLGAVAGIAGVLVVSRAVDLARGDPSGTPAFRRLNAVVAILIVVVGLAVLPIWRPTDPGLDAPAGILGMAPPGITGALRDSAQAGDHVFNPQPWGSWLEFELPDLPVAMDSRIEMYPEQVWKDYDTIAAGFEGWQAKLDEWQVAFVIVADGDDQFVDRLTTIGWTSVYTDDDGSILASPGR